MRALRKLFLPLLAAFFFGSFLFAGTASAAQCKISIPSASGNLTGIQDCNAFPGVANLVRQAGGDPSGASCYDVTSQTQAVEVVGCTGFAQSNPNPQPDPTQQAPTDTTSTVTGNDSCGGAGDQVSTTINFGCSHSGNPVIDLLFAVIRFLTAGVGVVVIAVVIIGGVQYVTAQGEPQKQAAARGRVINALLALLFYLFIFAILQWLIPGGIFSWS